ncbi:unnamed protein product [Symbiodinium microadriaticum]|nr:unnamed protein product [Symbiodinium microadriaticum]
MGIKASSPLRLASDDIFDDVLQIPKGSVNPFVLAQESCSEIFLLLDKQFLSCEGKGTCGAVIVTDVLLQRKLLVAADL